jgi:hypothetical protein
MSSITNLTGLPDPIYQAVIGEPRNTGNGAWSVTELLQPPRQLMLQRRYANQITEDAADSKNTFLGTALDDYVRRYAKPPWESCERKFITIEVDGEDHIISGEADLYDHATKTMVDLKVTSTFELANPKIEKFHQLAIYRYIYTVNGYQVDAIANALILKDWTEIQAGFKKDYPDHSIMMHHWEVPTLEWTEEFIKERIRLHRDASDDTLCTPEEKWEESKWAVIKSGGERAVKGGVFDSEEAAEGFVETLGEEYEIQFRQGEPRRCRFYCSVGGSSGLCAQWNGEKD